MYLKLLLITLLSITIISCEKKETENKDNKSIEKKSEKNTDIIKLTDDAIKLADIVSKKVVKKSYQELINTTGNIKETENSTFKINSVVSGKLVKENLNIGDFVSKGQKIADVQNAEAIKVYANYIHEYHNNEVAIKQSKIKLELSKNTLKREKNLLEQGISSKKDFLQAENDYNLNKAELEGLEEHRTHLTTEAKALLSTYGITLSSTTSETINSISPIISQKSGVVTKKNINLGSMVTPEQILYEISDLSKVYLEISLYGKDLSIVKKGQNVIFYPENSNNKAFMGQISYISPDINKETQTFIARVILENKNNELKTGIFGKVVIKGKKEESKIYIPEESLQTYQKNNFVFIDAGDGKFKKVNVEIDKKFDNGYLISKGLNEENKVVEKGAFNLKSELLKSQFAEEE
ncbi:MAG: efflux RND transporter periplasmic adaptor subunit [Candidatus Sericytochromatia bacterium]